MLAIALLPWWIWSATGWAAVVIAHYLYDLLRERNWR